MTASLTLRIAVFVLAACATCLAQDAPDRLPLAPVPADPLELATGANFLPQNLDQRSYIVGLLLLARRNARMHTGDSVPFALKVSFVSASSSGTEESGEMEESWVSPQQWKWRATLDDFSQLRVFWRGAAYDEKTPGAMPLRLQMVREAIFWPMNADLGRAAIRVTASSWNGVEVRCALLSGNNTDLSETPGRLWEESEYCVDPQSGLLQTYSVAPGIYVAYDYSETVKFHGQNVPRQITVEEAGVTVLKIHLDSLEDVRDTNPKLFTPSEEMLAAGPGAFMQGPFRIRQFAGRSPEPFTNTVRPVIVHAIVASDGRVLDAEALQNWDPALTRAAVNFVKGNRYGSTSPTALPSQRDYLINVLFGVAGTHPAMARGQR